MSDVLDRFRLLADDFSARVGAVETSAWDNQSPCEDWKARDVLNHVIGNFRHFAAFLDGAEAVPVDPSADPVAAWRDARAGLEAALADPDKASRVVPTPMGEMPFEMFAGRILSVDMLVHTWDLARAAGLDDRIDADAAGHAYQGLKPMDGMIRGPGMFKAAVEPPADADAQTLLLCFLGRQV